MGQPEPGDFVADYARLGARIGCDFEELKRSYRRAVRELHPDLNPDLADDAHAQGNLRELLSAFRRLNDYYRHFGRLPGEPRAPGANPPRPAQPSGTITIQPRRSTIGPALVLLLAGVGTWLLIDHQPPSQATLPTIAVPAHQPDLRASRPLHADGRTRSFASTGPGASAVRIGDNKQRVRQILGAPIVASAETWDYGPSHVRFKDGRVVDWYSSPLKPIAVDDSSRRSAADSSSH